MKTRVILGVDTGKSPKERLLIREYPSALTAVVVARYIASCDSDALVQVIRIYKSGAIKILYQSESLMS